MIIISGVTERDLPHLVEIEQTSISPPWSEDALRGEIRREDSFFPVAFLDGVAAGFCVLRRMADEGELLRIAVDASYRRRGVADVLMGAVVEFARDNALTAIFLEVRESNMAAVGLYRKHGFIEAGRRKGYYDKPAEDALIFARK